MIVDDNPFVDDHLNDESTKVFEFIQDHLNHSVTINYIKNEKNLGVGETRNRGLLLASAEWISFIDSDDEIDKDFVSFFREKEQKHKFNVFVGKYSFSQGNKMFIDNAITWLHGKIYKLSFLKYNGITFPPLRFNEDGGFNLMAHEMSRRVYVYPEDKIIYRWKNNPNSLTKKDNSKDYSTLNYIKSSTFAFKKILKKYEINQTLRLPATIFQLYLFYSELLYRELPTKECEVAMKDFFDTIRHSKWYESNKMKRGFEDVFISKHNIEPLIAEISLGQFIRIFEKEPLNFR